MSFNETKNSLVNKEWSSDELSNVAKIVDSLHKTPKYSNKGYPMVRVTDVKSGNISLENCLSVDEEIYNIFTKNHIPKRGDIVISRVGSYGIFSYINTDEKMCLGQNTAIISPTINNRYLYYSLQSPYIKEQIEKLVVGSTQKTLSLGNIKSLKIPICNLKEQKEIAKILSDLDSKIEINNKINTKLEEMAQAIFKQWFVDFEFPNEEGNPYKSSGGEMVKSQMGMVPNGWVVKSLGDISEVISKGTTPTMKQLEMSSEHNKVNFIKVKDITNDGVIEQNDIQKIPQSIHLGVLKRSILKENDILFSIAGTIGRVSHVNKEILPANINQAIAFIRLQECSKHFNIIYYYFKSQEIQNNINSKIVQGVQANISLTVLKNMEIAIPKDNILINFNNIVGDVFKKIDYLNTENNILRNIRELLIPKLMSGEIRVPLD